MVKRTFKFDPCFARHLLVLAWHARRCESEILKLTIGRTLILGAIALMLGLFGCLSYYVWPPDIISGRPTILGSVESQDGERFQVIQFWNHNDFYTTQLTHFRPDASTNIAVIDSDDRKEWSCSIRLIEEEKKVVVFLKSKKQVFEYRWDCEPKNIRR
jgi:hypothetical protein